jgi:hypothetical protein
MIHLYGSVLEGHYQGNRKDCPYHIREEVSAQSLINRLKERDDAFISGAIVLAR